MDNIQLFRTKIDKINRKFGLVPFQKETDTHLISVNCRINGDQYSSSVVPLSPDELKKAYQKCIHEIEMIKKFSKN